MTADDLGNFVCGISRGEARIYCLGGYSPRIMASAVARAYNEDLCLQWSPGTKPPEDESN